MTNSDEGRRGPTPPPGVDFIGDIHGQLGALLRLARSLGYEVGNGWRHADGRIPVFLGDLVDRGPRSLETARLVADLAADRRAFCLMGNHEYNLVCWHAGLPGWEEPKRSNRPTTEDVRRRPDDWAPALTFFRTLPLALELPDLRAIHAVWHLPSVRAAQPLLAPAEPRGHDAVGWLEAHVALGSPFAGRRLRAGVAASGRGEPDTPHEVLMKGHEAPATAPFEDADGHPRTEIRVTWWRGGDAEVPDDRPLVFGHYWNLPPAPPPGLEPWWAPPHPSGTDALRRWHRELGEAIPPEGRRRWDGPFACVDFNGLTRSLGDDRACVGAVRWPEREIVWASGRSS